MIFPSINDLSQGKYNRYEIALATAKCARRITNEYVRQRTEAERAITGNKETDRPLNAMIDIWERSRPPRSMDTVTPAAMIPEADI